MGSCLSSSATTVRRRSDLEKQLSKANVVSPNGQLRQYEVPVTVAQVLIDEHQPESMEVGGLSNSKSSFFVCNSDNLYFNEHIKAMDTEDVLQEGQIYFLLPSSKLRLPLSASEMAALAVKATIALQKTPPSSDSNRGRRQARISPVIEEAKVASYINNNKANSYIDGEDHSVQMTVKNSNYNYNYNYPSGSGVGSRSSSSTSPSLRSGSVRKFQRSSSKRARILMAARSFKIKLSTIYEGTIV